MSVYTSRLFRKLKYIFCQVQHFASFAYICSLFTLTCDSLLPDILLIILLNIENMPRIPSAYKPYGAT
jgi:hypothetical protein